MFISLKESVYKCSGSKCMYPFINYIYRDSKCSSAVYRYERVLPPKLDIWNDVPTFVSKQPENIESNAAIPENVDNFNLTWLPDNDNGNSSFYDTIQNHTNVINDYTFDESVLTNFLNMCGGGDDTEQTESIFGNTELNNSNEPLADETPYDINEFIDEICKDYTITDLNCVNPDFGSDTISSPKPAFNIPKPSGNVPTTPKLAKCIKHIENISKKRKIQKRSPRKQYRSRVKIEKIISIKAEKCTIPKLEIKPCVLELDRNINKRQPLVDEISIKQNDTKTTISKLLANKDSYSPMDLLSSITSLDFSSITADNSYKLDIMPKVIKPKQYVKKSILNKIKLEDEPSLPKRPKLKESSVPKMKFQNIPNKILETDKKSIQSHKMVTMDKPQHLQEDKATTEETQMLPNLNGFVYLTADSIKESEVKPAQRILNQEFQNNINTKINLESVKKTPKDTNVGFQIHLDGSKTMHTASRIKNKLFEIKSNEILQQPLTNISSLMHGIKILPTTLIVKDNLTTPNCFDDKRIVILNHNHHEHNVNTTDIPNVEIANPLKENLVKSFDVNANARETLVVSFEAKRAVNPEFKGFTKKDIKKCKQLDLLKQLINNFK